jgi:hypothetical protein
MSPLLACLAVALYSPTQSDALSELAAKQGIRIEIRNAAFTDQAKGYVISGGSVSESNMEKYKSLWVREWSRYSKDLLRQAKVDVVTFAEKLSVDGQIRAAVPAFDLRAMYYDPELGSKYPDYQRSVIHHEFFHTLDERMGKLKRDPEWTALNSPGFKYGDGGEKMRTNGVGNLSDKFAGFLTQYGTASLAEDKAELYAHLLVDPGEVAARLKNDSVLAKKVELLKKRLQEYSSNFTPDFWSSGN